MKNRVTALVIVVAIGSLAIWQLGRAPESTNLLINPGFEAGATNDETPIIWYDTDGTRYETLLSNWFTPDGWTGWFIKSPCGGGWVAGQPEAGLITTYVDPHRVHSGNNAFRLFTTWRCNHGGLWQVVDVEPGAEYQASVYAHAWHSQCSTQPYNVPLDYDCATLFDSHQWLSIGLDPTGNTDPRASTIQWSTYEVYGLYGDALRSPAVKAIGPTMTVFLRSETWLPLKHNDAHFDDVRLERVYRVFLPRVGK